MPDPIAVPTLSRRRFFGLSATTAAAASTGLLSAAARAQAPDAPSAPPANAGHYHTRVGELRVTLLNDGHFNFDPVYPSLGGNADADQVAQALDQFRLPADGLSDIHAMLVRSADRTVLIDAGSGDTFAPTAGKLIANLRAAGVQPADVTDILVTHAHLDHIGGFTIPGTTDSAFPNAAVHIAQAEYDFWRSQPALKHSGMSEAMKQMVIQIANNSLDHVQDQLEFFDGAKEHELLPGFTAVPAAGHTPGHTAFLVHDGDQQLLFVGDLIFMPPLLTRNPDWYVGFDSDQPAAAATRFALMDRIAADRLRIAGTHLPFPAFAQLTRNGGGFDYHPEPWRF
ncbi:MAG: MBL fold metallo-hydrolase [Planctomycetota bacterium]